MTATPPEAETEYSRGSKGSGTVFPRRYPGPDGIRGAALRAILAVALVGALLMIAAELTPLFTVHVAGTTTPVRTVTTGSHHAHALLPLAALAALLSFVCWREESRAGALAIGVLGVIALLIALIGDLSDASATGVIRSSAARYLAASSTPGPGMYLETLGAVLLVIASVSAFLVIGRPASPAPDGHRAGSARPARRSAS